MGTFLVSIPYKHQMASFTDKLFLFNLLACHANIISGQGFGIRNSDDTMAIPSENKKFMAMFGFSTAQYVRQEWDRILPKIILRSEHEKFSALIEEMVDVNPCVNSLKAYTIFLEQRVKLIEECAPQIEDVILNVFSLRGVRNLTTLTLGGAEILSNLNNLYPVFISSFGCHHDPDVAVNALHDLALNLYKQSLVEDIPNINNALVRQNILWAAQVTDILAGFLDHFTMNLARIDCYTSEDYLGDFITLASRTIDDIAQAFGALLLYNEAKEIRQYAAFVSSFKESMRVLPDFNIPGDCTPGALGRYSTIFKAFSNILSDVGLDALFMDIGMSFRLDLLP